MTTTAASPSPALYKPSATADGAAMNPIQKKLNELFDSKLETDQDLLDALDVVAPLFAENTVHTRRNLRRDLELQNLEVNRQFVESFRKVHESIETVTKDIEKMNTTCQSMADRLQSSKERTRDLINRTTTLQNQRKKVEKRTEVAKSFLSVFQLTEDEQAALKGSPSDGAIGREYFTALQRVKEIHGDCKQLLRTSGQHNAAMELMERMAGTLEAAYEVLYRSIQRECRLLNVEFAELRPVLYQSFAAMQDRPVLFKYSLDEYTTARRNHIVRAYIDALTRGGSHGTPKPIELLSHDALRYVGDMLAWIHQAMASERDLLQTLLKMCKPETLQEHSTIVLGQISEALCRPFQVRVEQALASESGCVVLYRLSSLFTFYADTMSSTLTAGSEMVKTVLELQDLTKSMFFSGLNTTVQRLLARMATPDYDLLPVQVLHQVLILLRDVLESHDAGLATAADKRENFVKIFATVLDPLHQALAIATTQIQSPLDVAVYQLNCLSTIHSVIALYQYTDQRLEMLKAQMDANEDVLVSEQATAILTRTGLMDCYTKATAGHAQGPGIEASDISTALAKLDNFLAKPDNYRLEQFGRITSTKIRESVQNRTFENVIAAYGAIYAMLTDPANGYGGELKDLKTVDQIKKLLKGGGE